MPLIAMRVLVPFVHEGRSLTPGEIIEVAATTAAILRYQRKADFATITVAPPSATKRRTYKRRDLNAES